MPSTRSGRQLPSRHHPAFILLAVLILVTPGLTPRGVAASPAEAPATTAVSSEKPAPLTAFRLQGPVRVDGVLDETDWQRPAQDGMIQNEPANGAAPVQATLWWIAYDDDALYAAFRLYDSAPDSIDTAIARRDVFLSTDHILLQLDTYNDDRNAYAFDVSAGGCRCDFTIYNDSWDDFSWDGVWEAATRVDEQGWTAEMRIPFSQLRFSTAEDQVWGINVSRRYKRNSGRDDLFLRPRNESGHASRFPDLVGISGVAAKQNREALLYGVVRGEFLETQAGDPFNDGSKAGENLGADLRWGLTSNLTLNLAINPDFGQVEMDPAVVNLSDFETYYGEKRPFFVAESNVFSFGREGTSNNWNFNWMDPTPFYSRRVGRTPQLGIEGDYDYAQTPSGTTILGAGKITGKMGGTTIGVLNAVTARERHDLTWGGVRSDELAEPLTDYSVLRVSHTPRDARRSLGLMITGIHRDLSDAQSRATLVRRAYTAGLDGWTLLDGDGVWALRAYASGSLIRGDAGAIELQQESSRRYFQRPDADHLDYDPTRTSLSGWASRFVLNKEKGNVRLNTGLGAVSPGYEINDMGFQYRADEVNTHLAAGYQWTEPNRWARTRVLDFTTYWTWDTGGTRNGGGLGVFGWLEFANYWSADGHVFYNPAYDHTRATRGGPVMRLPSQQEFDLSVYTDSRKPVVLSANGGAGGADERGHYGYGGVGLTLKPSSALQLSFNPAIFWQQDRAQWVTGVDDPAMTATYGRRYIFSDFDYREISMSARVDWSFSPRLTLQTYVQPLLAVGDYTQLKEFARPGTYDFNVYGRDGSTLEYDKETATYTVDPGDGGSVFTVDDPDFNFKSLRVNMVLRWEYSPGSTFYLVWTRNGVDDSRPGRLELGRDMRSLMGAPSDDIVLAKITNWFDF